MTKGQVVLIKLKNYRKKVKQNKKEAKEGGNSRAENEIRIRKNVDGKLRRTFSLNQISNAPQFTVYCCPNGNSLVVIMPKFIAKGRRKPCLGNLLKLN